MDEYTDNGTTHHNREQTMQGTQKSTALTERIVQLEWEQFQNTTNEGGPASCQSNWPMFHEMRMSQFLTWPESLLQSYESSDSTLHEYESFIHELQAEHKNLTELTIANTVKLAGFAGLEDAESAQ